MWRNYGNGPILSASKRSYTSIFFVFLSNRLTRNPGKFVTLDDWRDEVGNYWFLEHETIRRYMWRIPGPIEKQVRIREFGCDYENCPEKNRLHNYFYATGWEWYLGIPTKWARCLGGWFKVMPKVNGLYSFRTDHCDSQSRLDVVILFIAASSAREMIGQLTG